MHRRHVSVTETSPRDVVSQHSLAGAWGASHVIPGSQRHGMSAHPADGGTPRFRLRTLGALSLVNERASTGTASEGILPRGRLALLAALALAGTDGVSRERLMALFWPESDEDRARAALRQAVYAIRSALGADAAITGTTELRLNSAIVSSDLSDFFAAISRGDLLSAVNAYGGPFLLGTYLTGNSAVERWIEDERARASDIYSRALEELATRSTTAGDHEAAAAWWDRRAALEPLSSRVTRRLMESLAASGDPQSAIRCGRAHVQLVRAELDAAPEPELTALLERLTSRAGALESTPIGTDLGDTRVNGDRLGIPSSGPLSDESRALLPIATWDVQSTREITRRNRPASATRRLRAAVGMAVGVIVVGV